MTRETRGQVGQDLFQPGNVPGDPPQEHDVGRDPVLRPVEILRDEGLVFTVPARQQTSSWAGSGVKPSS